MRIILTTLAAILLLAVCSAWWVSRPAFDQPFETPRTAFEILPVDTALTLAMTQEGNVLLVVAASENAVQAVDINQTLNSRYRDSISAYMALGYDGLVSIASSSPITLDIDALTLPLRPHYPHIAAGTNFKAHAQEVGLEGEPFLFPKLARATAWNAAVPVSARLDYEVELCAVPLASYTATGPAHFGYLLCNDFTDRWTLLREIELDSPMGHTGFADAKGGAGKLPVGPFLVVPRDDTGFYNELEIALGVNGALRQRERAGLMIWSPHEIATAALQNCNVDFPSLAGTHKLTDCEEIAAGTLMLTGTPAGVMFHLLNIWRSSSYLAEGDEVVASADHLGVLRNRIQ